jgi:hypothetical protein
MSWSLIIFAISLVVGFSLHLLDYFLFPWYAAEDHQLARQLRASWSKGMGQYARSVWAVRTQLSPLLMESIIFVAVQVGLLIYLMSSSLSPVGIGLILGLNGHSLFQWWGWRTQPEVFNARIGWLQQMNFTQSQITRLFFAYLGVIAIVCLLFLV